MKRILLASLLSISAFCAEYIVDQKNKTYIPHSLDVLVGDTIILKNSDTYPHISFSGDPVNGFYTGLQKPGEIKKIKVNGKGKFIIKCSIHPNMVMEVNVR